MLSRLLLIALLLGAAGPEVARAQVACGATVTTKVKMTADLSGCINNPTFTIDGGSVDMDGHRVSACGGCMGVQLIGKGSSLSNGTVVGGGGLSIVVRLDGQGGHRLRNVVARGGYEGFVATTDNNKLENCVAVGNTTRGFDIGGDKNSLMHCHSNGGSIGISSSGAGNKLQDNTASDASSYAFLTSGDGNKLLRNRAVASKTGFWVPGSFNKLTSNIATSSTNLTLGSCGFEIGSASQQKQSLTRNIAAANADGFLLYNNSSSATKNVALGNALNGIRLAGDFNKLTSNVTHGNNEDGIHLNQNSDNNKLVSNHTSGNGNAGIYIGNPGAVANQIRKSVALGNGGYDLDDSNGNCASNVWSSNLFGDSQAGGTPSDPCID